jgi:hypothetical protein
MCYQLPPASALEKCMREIGVHRERARLSDEAQARLNKQLGKDDEVTN